MRTIWLKDLNNDNDYDSDFYTKEFIEAKRLQGVIKSTLDQYRWALQDLHQNKESAPTTKDLLRCLPPEMGSGYYNKRLSTYHQFYNFVNGLGGGLNWDWKNIRYKKKKYNIVDHDIKEVKDFLKGFDQRSFAGYRDYVMALLILDTGIRPSEALRIYPSDLNNELKEVHLRAEITKTGVERIVPLSSLVYLKIRKLIGYTPKEWANPPIFCSDTGEPFGTGNYQDRVREINHRQGTHITPYELRHIFATTFIRKGGNVFALQRILGHSSIKTTQVYVNLTTKDLHSQHDKLNIISEFINTKKVSLNMLDNI